MTSRPDAEDAFTASPQLDGICKDLLFVLWYLADSATGFIEPQRQPSLNRLADLSGWHRATVVRHLPHLAAPPPWLERKVPPVEDQRRFHARTSYVLLVPASARRTEHPGLGAERDGLGAQGDGLGAERDMARRRARPELGAEGDGLGAERDTLVDRQKSTSAKPWEDEDFVELARETLAEIGHPAPNGAVAAAAVRLILEDADDIRRPRRYLRASIRREPRKFLPAPAQPAPPRRPEPARLTLEEIQKITRAPKGEEQ